jgi:hypothetical protein
MSGACPVLVSSPDEGYHLEHAGGFQYDPEIHVRAWRWLADQDVDVALVQEAVPPGWAHERWPVILHAPKYPGSDHLPWGTAIISRDVTIEEYVPTSADPWLSDLRGSGVVARPVEAGGTWFVSVHSNAYPLNSDQLSAGPGEVRRRCHDTKA